MNNKEIQIIFKFEEYQKQYIWTTDAPKFTDKDSLEVHRFLKKMRKIILKEMKEFNMRHKEVKIYLTY